MQTISFKHPAHDWKLLQLNSVGSLRGLSAVVGGGEVTIPRS